MNDVNERLRDKSPLINGIHTIITGIFAALLLWVGNTVSENHSANKIQAGQISQLLVNSKDTWQLLTDQIRNQGLLGNDSEHFERRLVQLEDRIAKNITSRLRQVEQRVDAHQSSRHIDSAHFMKLETRINSLFLEEPDRKR